MKPGIHERIYEFCFNTEFCQRFNALLATHPLIPSQRMERDLGYDVEFQIRQEGYTTSVFLQYKVAHFVQNRKGKNARFYGSHSGAYYRFPLSDHQHNILHILAQQNEKVYYCAPMFYTRNELTEYAMQCTIYTNSVWLPLRSMNPVKSGRHNITYSVDGSLANVHSEANQVEIIKLADYNDPRNWPVRRREDAFIERYSERALHEVHSLAEKLTEFTFSAKGSAPEQMNPHYEVVARLKKPIEKVQYILGRIYDVSWLLLKP